MDLRRALPMTLWTAAAILSKPAAASYNTGSYGVDFIPSFLVAAVFYLGASLAWFVGTQLMLGSYLQKQAAIDKKQSQDGRVLRLIVFALSFLVWISLSHVVALIIQNIIIPSALWLWHLVR